MKRILLGVTSVIMTLILLLNLAYVQPVTAGAWADFFGIENGTVGFFTDNGFDYGGTKLSDYAIKNSKNLFEMAKDKARLARKLYKNGNFGASKYMQKQSTKYIRNISKFGRYTKALGGTLIVLNVYNTAGDTYALFTKDSKHGTWQERWIDKGLGAMDAGMGWYAIGLGAAAIFAAPTIGAGILAAGAVTGATYIASKLTIGLTRTLFNSKTYRNLSAWARGKKKIVLIPFNTPGRKEGLDIIKEEFGFDLYPGLNREIPDPNTGIPVYKPNIYLYSDNNSTHEVTLWIELSELLVSTIPIYNPSTGWTGVIKEGSLNGTQDYLFYEAIVPDNDFQLEEGYIISSKTLEKDMTDMLSNYKFSEKETVDFLEYWLEKLDSSENYVFYPQDTKIIDKVMPLSISSDMDSYFRLWFYITPYNQEKLVKPINISSIKEIERKGEVLVEWGGLMKGDGGFSK